VRTVLKAREKMDLRNVAAKLSTIDALEQRVTELELVVLELAAGVSEPSDSVKEAEVLTLPELSSVTNAEVEQENRRATVWLIESHIIQGIGGWKWSRQHGPDHIACPLTASAVAGRLNLDVHDVQKLIKDPDAWPRLAWRKLPIPPSHPEAKRGTVSMHVIAPRKGA
jgi:hypothetical protein